MSGTVVDNRRVRRSTMLREREGERRGSFVNCFAEGAAKNFVVWIVVIFDSRLLGAGFIVGGIPSCWNVGRNAELL